MEQAAQEVWAVVEAMNACWTQGNPDGLINYFHPRMVAIVPGQRQRLVGAAACIAGWAGYANHYDIRRFVAQEPQVELFGDAAVVSYYFEMEVCKDGVVSYPQGRELYFMVREQGRWWAVANQFSANPSVL